MSDLYEEVKGVPPLPTSLNPTPYVEPPPREYWDKREYTSRDAWLNKLRKSTTVYVGNLSFYTTEAQLWELFSKCGYVKNVVLGLNAFKKSPCGFAFVVFTSVESTLRAVNILNGSVCDGRIIRVDRDTGGEGLERSRRFGRGQHGMQWRDEFRKDYDIGRGGEGGGIDYDAYQTENYRKRRRISSTAQNEASYGLLQAPLNDFLYRGRTHSVRAQIPPPPPPHPQMVMGSIHNANIMGGGHRAPFNHHRPFHPPRPSFQPRSLPPPPPPPVPASQELPPTSPQLHPAPPPSDANTDAPALEATTPPDTPHNV